MRAHFGSAMVAAVRSGATSPSAWAELGEIVAGAAPRRRGDDGMTLFKSVGLAVQDLVASGRVLAAARRDGRGRSVEL